MDLEYQRKIDEMHTALVGNNLGQKGLVKRVEELEQEKEENKAIKYKVIGAGAVLSFVGSGFVTWLLKHFA